MSTSGRPGTYPHASRPALINRARIHLPLLRGTPKRGGITHGLEGFRVMSMPGPADIQSCAATNRTGMPAASAARLALSMSPRSSAA